MYTFSLYFLVILLIYLRGAVICVDLSLWIFEITHSLSRVSFVINVLRRKNSWRESLLIPMLISWYLFRCWCRLCSSSWSPQCGQPALLPMNIWATWSSPAYPTCTPGRFFYFLVLSAFFVSDHHVVIFITHKYWISG